MAMKQKNLPAIVPELFEHEQFGNFRYIKRGEEILFVAVDVCRVLGYTNSRKALKDHVPDKFKADVTIRYTSSNNVEQNRRVTLISEPGLYRLIMRSNLPAAEKFMDWVCEEVLPSIRKYGFYGLLNGEQARQLPDKEYIRYLGGLNCFQYDAHLKQLTPKQRGEHYWRIEEMIPNMTQEEIKSLANDPYITVSRIGNAPWKASIC